MLSLERASSHMDLRKVETACQGLPTHSPSICLSFAVGKPTVLTDPCRLPDSSQPVFWWEEKAEGKDPVGRGRDLDSPFFSWRVITECRLNGANSLEQCVLPSKQLVDSMHILVPFLPRPTLVWVRLLVSEISIYHKCITGSLACSVSLFIYPKHACHLNLVEISWSTCLPFSTAFSGSILPEDQLAGRCCTYFPLFPSLPRIREA